MEWRAARVNEAVDRMQGKQRVETAVNKEKEEIKRVEEVLKESKSLK
jgi:hypothetical protein